jgi:hypothetical protein
LSWTIPKSLRELVSNLISQSWKGYVKERCELVGPSLFEFLFANADTLLTLIATCLWRGSRCIVTHEIWNSTTQSLLSINLRTQYYSLNAFLCGIKLQYGSLLPLYLPPTYLYLSLRSHC